MTPRMITLPIGGFTLRDLRNQHDYFDTTHINADLKGHTVRGGVATLVAQGYGLIVSVGSTAILARLLIPADFGLVAMVTALTGILAMFKDAGLSMATVQQDQITHDQVSVLFWVNVALGIGLAIIVAALSPGVAWFYNEPKLLQITLVVAGLFAFDGFAVQHQALLRRQMRFKSLAKIQVLSSTLALIATIAAALMGAGYWALLVQLSVAQLFSVLLSWVYCRWVPGGIKRRVGARAMLTFGGYLTGFSFINYFARNGDNILIGKVWGSDQLGVYSRAYSLLLFPLQQINGPISAVAIPALSRLQNNPEEFLVFFRKVLSIISFIAFPIIAWMIVCRREIILIVLGPQWEDAIPIFGALAISAFAHPIGNISGILYIVLGRTRRMFNWGLIGCSWIILSFFIGLPYGPIGVAMAYSIAILLMIIPQIIYAVSGTFVNLHDFYIGIIYPLVSTLFALVVALLVRSLFLTGVSLLFNFAITSVSIAFSYLFFSHIFSPNLLQQVFSIFFKKYKIEQKGECDGHNI